MSNSIVRRVCLYRDTDTLIQMLALAHRSLFPRYTLLRYLGICMCFDKPRIARKAAITTMQGQPFREQADMWIKFNCKCGEDISLFHGNTIPI